jgi:REP element-mobilizing transposase RayT
MTTPVPYRARPNEPPLPDPLAFFLTWTTYGTWLSGDERGWAKRSGGIQAPDPSRKRRAERLMAEPPCHLRDGQRRLVEETIADNCRIRGWHLHTVTCRTNHVHVVVAAQAYHPEVIRDQFKAWCTRKLKERQQSRYETVRKNWWTERGSERYINDEQGLEAAILYVRDFQ